MRQHLRQLVLAILLLSAVALAWDSLQAAWAARSEQQQLAARLPAWPPQPLPPCATPAQPPLRLLVLGQSNAGNHAEAAAPTASEHSLRLWQVKDCGLASDPLPGATGTGASPWTALAEALARQGLHREPELALLAVESTRIDQWVMPSSPLQQRLIARLRELRASGWRPDAVLWQQGEADAKAATRPEHYLDSFMALQTLLRQEGIEAPLLLALSSRCEGVDNSALRELQQSLPKVLRGVLAGPDTDSLGPALRSGPCHFNAQGRLAVARLWAEALSQLPPK